VVRALTGVERRARDTYTNIGIVLRPWALREPCEFGRTLARKPGDPKASFALASCILTLGTSKRAGRSTRRDLRIRRSRRAARLRRAAWRARAALGQDALVHAEQASAMRSTSVVTCLCSPHRHSRRLRGHASLKRSCARFPAVFRSSVAASAFPQSTIIVRCSACRSHWAPTSPPFRPSAYLAASRIVDELTARLQAIPGCAWDRVQGNVVSSSSSGPAGAPCPSRRLRRLRPFRVCLVSLQKGRVRATPTQRIAIACSIWPPSSIAEPDAFLTRQRSLPVSIS